MMAALSRYSHRFTHRMHMSLKHPLARSIMITTTGFGVSDVICQSIEYKAALNKNKNHKFIWNKSRTFKFTFIGFLFGPQFHFWFPFIASLIPGQGAKNAFKKVLIDQSVMGTWATVFVLSMKPLMEGKGFEGAKTNVRQHFGEVYLRACCIFPPGQFINYLLIPARYRVLWLNGIGFCWRILLSYLVFGKQDK